MREQITIFFDAALKLRICSGVNFIEDSRDDRLYQWSDDHHYDLLSLLGERYMLYGWYNELSYQLMVSKIFDQQADMYVSPEHKQELLAGHRYMQTVSEKSI